MVIEITTINAVNIDLERGRLKHIDIYNRNNGHSEIEYRMKPIHDIQEGGVEKTISNHNIEFSYNHYPPEVNYSGWKHQKSRLVYFLPIGIVVTNIKFFPIRELSYHGHHINGYCEAYYPKILVN